MTAHYATHPRHHHPRGVRPLPAPAGQHRRADCLGYRPRRAHRDRRVGQAQPGTGSATACPTATAAAPPSRTARTPTPASPAPTSRPRRSSCDIHRRQATTNRRLIARADANGQTRLADNLRQVQASLDQIIPALEALQADQEPDDDQALTTPGSSPRPTPSATRRHSQARARHRAPRPQRPARQLQRRRRSSRRYPGAGSTARATSATSSATLRSRKPSRRPPAPAHRADHRIAPRATRRRPRRNHPPASPRTPPSATSSPAISASSGPSTTSTPSRAAMTPATTPQLRRRHVYAAETPAHQALSDRRLQITADMRGRRFSRDQRG